MCERKSGLLWLSFPETKTWFSVFGPVMVLTRDMENGGRIHVSLGQAGCGVRIARSWEQAAMMMREIPPAGLIVDTQLDEHGPLAVAERVRAHPKGAPVQLIALTATENRNERRRLAAAGFVAALPKPVQVALFAQQLASALR